MENNRVKAGNLLVAVPEGYTVRTGTNMGDADDNQVWLQTTPPTFRDYYWIILKEAEKEVDNSIQMTKQVNNGTDAESFTLGDTAWSGTTYSYGDMPCNVLKGVTEGAVYQVTIIGHEIQSPEAQTVLESISKAN